MCRCQCSHHFHRFEEALAGRSILDKSTVAIPRDIKVLLAIPEQDTPALFPW